MIRFVRCPGNFLKVGGEVPEVTPDSQIPVRRRSWTRSTRCGSSKSVIFSISQHSQLTKTSSWMASYICTNVTFLPSSFLISALFATNLIILEHRLLGAICSFNRQCWHVTKVAESETSRPFRSASLGAKALAAESDGSARDSCLVTQKWCKDVLIREANFLSLPCFSQSFALAKDWWYFAIRYAWLNPIFTWKTWAIVLIRARLPWQHWKVAKIYQPKFLNWAQGWKPFPASRSPCTLQLGEAGGKWMLGREWCIQAPRLHGTCCTNNLLCNLYYLSKLGKVRMRSVLVFLHGWVLVRSYPLTL